MYSSRAVVTASFLVRWPPVRRASSMSLSSIARLVAMCRVLHITMCSASWLATQKKIGDGCPSPASDCANVLAKAIAPELLHLVEFHTVPGVYIFHGEDDHTGCGGR